MRKLARGSVVDVDERGLVRFNAARERFDRDQMNELGGLGRGLSDEDKERLRRKAKGLTDIADSFVDTLNGLGRWLVDIPAPVWIGAALWWLGPSAVAGGVAGEVSRSRRRPRRGRRRGRR